VVVYVSGAHHLFLTSKSRWTMATFATREWRIQHFFSTPQAAELVPAECRQVVCVPGVAQPSLLYLGFLASSVRFRSIFRFLSSGTTRGCDRPVSSGSSYPSVVVFLWGGVKLVSLGSEGAHQPDVLFSRDRTNEKTGGGTRTGRR